MRAAGRRHAGGSSAGPGRSPPRRPNVAGCLGSPARSVASGHPSAAAAVARIPRSSVPSGRWSGPHAHVRPKSGAPTPFKRSYNNSEHLAADLASNHIGRRSEHTRTQCARRVSRWRVVSAIIASVLLAITVIICRDSSSNCRTLARLDAQLCSLYARYVAAVRSRLAMAASEGQQFTQ